MGVFVHKVTSLTDNDDVALAVCNGKQWHVQQQTQMLKSRWYMQEEEDTLMEDVNETRKRRRQPSGMISRKQNHKRPRLLLTDAWVNISDSSAKPTAVSKAPSVGSPRSLQFALPDLSSSDTLYLLGVVRNLPHELTYLNHSYPTTSTTTSTNTIHHQVFGWRNALWLEPCPANGDARILWKSAKVLHSMRMRAVAKNVWNSSRQQASRNSSLLLDEDSLSLSSAAEVLYDIDDSARVVRTVDKLYGRSFQETIWLERYMDLGQFVCIARKQLKQFADYCVPEWMSTECHGSVCFGFWLSRFLFRPFFMGKRLGGTTIQTVRAVATRGARFASIMQQLVDDLPKFTLLWEESNVHALVPTYSSYLSVL